MTCRAHGTLPRASLTGRSKCDATDGDGGFGFEAQVTCEAGKLPERFRAVARVLLQSCDGRGVSFGSEYVAVRAEVQEPTVRAIPCLRPSVHRMKSHSKMHDTRGMHVIFLTPLAWLGEV